MSAAVETGDGAGSLSNDIILLFMPFPERPEWTDRVTKRYGLRVRFVSSIREDKTVINIADLGAEVWEGVTLLCTYMPPPAELIPKVRFVQLTSAGADKWLGHPKYQDKDTIICTSNGIHSPQIAEWVIGAWLSHQHHFARYHEHMKKGFWESPFATHFQDSVSLRIGILGYGAIGRQCARLATALGMEVYAYTRSERATPESRKDDSYCVPGTGDPDGVLPARWFHGASRAAVDDFLREGRFDLLVVCLPLTAETRHVVGRAQLAILGGAAAAAGAAGRPGAFVANVGRGGHVDQEALVEALGSGLVRGAAIDVADPEPLPAGHALWRAPNLLITPHVSWRSEALWDRLLDLVELNLGRLAEGRPLINVVNRELHY
ncbi:Transcription initiation factor IIA subunit 2 [Hypoxylon texense]